MRTRKARDSLEYDPSNQERRLTWRLAKREEWRAKRQLHAILSAAMSKEDVFEMAIERWHKLCGRVTRSVAEWTDLPGTLQYEANEVMALLRKSAAL